MIGWSRPSLRLMLAIWAADVFFPASSRAGSCGATKNSKKVATVTNHSTTMPSSSLRTRKLAKPMSARLRLCGRGRGLRPLARPAALALGREQPLGPRVQRVPHPVTEQVEGERGDEQEHAREDQVPPGGLVEALR